MFRFKVTAMLQNGPAHTFNKKKRKKRYGFRFYHRYIVVFPVNDPKGIKHNGVVSKHRFSYTSPRHIRWLDTLSEQLSQKQKFLKKQIKP